MPKYIVRHGVMRHLGVFSSSRGETFNRGVQVIARTSRGQEGGEVLCAAEETAVAHLDNPKNGQILRAMSSQDKLEMRKLFEQERGEFESCAKKIKELSLDMRLVDLERLYGGERVVVYYLADGRVDFRELVKLLASEYQTRVEMRQIGVRDEAKLLADYGDCGKPVCCNTHLSEMPPVSMKMAKLQKTTLDPNKISGRCGRLKCCLRYEYETYQVLQRELPPVGAEVVTEKGRAKVLSQEILSHQLLVQNEDMRRVLLDANDVLSVIKKKEGQAKPREGQAKPKETPARQEESRERAKERPEKQKKEGESRSNENRGKSNDGPKAD